MAPEPQDPNLLTQCRGTVFMESIPVTKNDEQIPFLVFKTATFGFDNAMKCLNYCKSLQKAKADPTWICTHQSYNADSTFPLYLHFITCKMGIVYSYRIFVISIDMVQKEPTTEAMQLINSRNKYLLLLLLFSFFYQEFSHIYNIFSDSLFF